jgi:hypothetical protein
MQCPYCIEDVNDAAIVCPHCRHDLAPSKLLIAENENLKVEIETLQAELVVLRAQTARTQADAQASERRKASPAKAILEDLVLYALAPIALLLLAHLLIIVLWDRPTLYLRIVSILLPMPFGFALVWRERKSLIRAIVFGAAVSFLAILGMLTVMHINYNDPVVPATAQDGIEELQYFISIALAYITGGLLAVMARSTPLMPGARPALLMSKLAPLLGPKQRKLGKRGSVDVSELLARAQSIQKIVTGIMATATTAGSIYTGVTSIWT